MMDVWVDIIGSQTPLIDQLPDPNATQILKCEVFPSSTFPLVARWYGGPGHGFAVGVFYVSQSNPPPPPTIKFVFIILVLLALASWAWVFDSW